MSGSLLYDLKPTDLISRPYLQLQQELHARPNGYGGKGDKWAAGVAGLIAQFEAHSVLDYGAGEGSLGAALRKMALSGVRIDEYDPAVPAFAQWPGFADLVVCTDVLEHIEPERLDTVLRHLTVLTRKALFVVIATRPSNKTMADGRNAHLIIETGEWWSARFAALGLRIAQGPASPLAKPSREWVAVIRP